MTDDSSTSNVIGLIYEASYKPDNWPRALEAIAKYTSSSSAGLLSQDAELEKAGGSYVYNVSDEDLLEYSNIKGGDPNFAIFAQNNLIGIAAATDHIITDRNELEKIFGDEWTKFAISADYYHTGGAILFMDEIRSAGIGLQRKRQLGVWEKHEIDKLNTLIPHLQRAINIHKEFIRLQTREQALKRGLDRLVMGLILFDIDMQPIYINPIAESILEYHPAISFQNNKIYGQSFEENETIHDAIFKACKSSNDEPESASTAFGLRHPKCSTILPVIISPIKGILSGFDTDGRYAHAVMCFSDPDRSQPIEADKLGEIYKLTSTEAQVAVSLANGMQAADVAELHQVAVSTVRTQIKSIYRKLGINNQMELVKLLLTGPFSRSL